MEQIKYMDTELETILDEYFVTNVNSNSNNSNPEWEASRDRWTESIIDEFLEVHGYLTPKQFGAKGGEARAKNLTQEQLSAIGKLGSEKRYKNKDELEV